MELIGRTIGDGVSSDVCQGALVLGLSKCAVLVPTGSDVTMVKGRLVEQTGTGELDEGGRE